MATATGVTAAVDLFRPDILTHAAYYPAALFATLIGGAASGVFAMTLGAVIAWWIFKPPYLGLIAAEHTDGAEYTKAKTELIQELTDRARADRGLPPVPVWEE